MHFMAKRYALYQNMGDEVVDPRGSRFAPAGLVGVGSEAPQEPHSLPTLRLPSPHKRNHPAKAGWSVALYAAIDTIRGMRKG